jgi:hypothetical protein
MIEMRAPRLIQPGNPGKHLVHVALQHRDPRVKPCLFDPGGDQTLTQMRNLATGETKSNKRRAIQAQAVDVEGPRLLWK